MKEPKAPKKPRKPILPTGTLTETVDLELDEYTVEGETLQSLLDKHFKNIPLIEISFRAYWDYESTTRVSLYANYETPNLKYEKGLVEYQEKLAKYEESLKAYNLKNKIYKAEMKEYKAFVEKEEMEKLKRRLAELEAKATND